MNDIAKNPPMVVRIARKKHAEGADVFMRLGKLLYVMDGLKLARDGGVPAQFDKGEYWIGKFAIKGRDQRTYRRFYDDADGIWTIRQQPEGWELVQRSQPEKVDEARRKKVDMAEPLDMKAELLLSLIDKEFQKERGIPTSINLFGRGLSGTLITVRRNDDNTVTFTAEITDSATGDKWNSVMTVDNKDLAHIKLTKQDGTLRLVGNKDTPFESVREDRDENLPLFLVMLRKLLAAGKSVYATSFDEGNNPMHALVKEVHFNEHFGTIDVDVEFDGENGPEQDQYGYTEDEAERLKLKNENDTWFIVDMEGNFR